MVGVLKTASLKLSDLSAKDQKPVEVQSSTLESPRKKLAAQKNQAQGIYTKKKVMSFALPKDSANELIDVKITQANKMKAKSQRPAFTRGIESRSVDNPSPGATRINFRSNSVQQEERLHARRTNRDALNDQDVLAATQFTPVELNRIITNVGGGYLIKKINPKSGGKTPALAENVEHYCYLGFDKLLNKSKKQRKDLRVSYLLS
jgi:hypothetical protein